MKFLFQLLLFSASVTYANMPREGFERFFNYYFVETGTYSGDGVKFALRAGFPEIFSIEVVETTYLNTSPVFESYKNVNLFLGNSGEILYDVIKDLKLIKKHPIKHHTILIDDMHCCEGILFDFHTKEEIIEKIKEINPDYEITYIDGGDDAEVKDNIMVAYVPFAKWEKADPKLFQNRGF